MAVCPKCFSRDVIKFGKYYDQQRWRCMKCGFTTISPRLRMPKKRRR
jgi:transposase-like protein